MGFEREGGGDLGKVSEERGTTVTAPFRVPSKTETPAYAMCVGSG